MARVFSRKEREWALRSCGAKVRYATEALAQSVVDARPGDGFEAYRCRLCDYFHVGHKKGVRRDPLDQFR